MSVNFFRRYAHFVLILMLMAVVISCSDDDNGTNPQPDNGFEAQISDFQGYTGWDILDYTVYPANISSGLGDGAHSGKDSTFVRVIYKNNDANLSGNSWARKSVFVKETFQWVNGQKQFAAMGGLLGMVKRSGEFNADHGGWEYFDLGDGSAIAGRGSNLMDGACQSCHAVVNNYGGSDFIFKHPTEYVVPANGEYEYFKNHRDNSWQMLDSRGTDQPHELLTGGAHGGNALTRDTYRWQPGGVFSNGEFPIGTVLLKEMYSVDSTSTKTVAAWTAMVKRGGEFDLAHGNWEYFLIETPDDVGTRTINRGALASCYSCHASAGTQDYAGGNYVFEHPGLGF